MRPPAIGFAKQNMFFRKFRKRADGHGTKNEKQKDPSYAGAARGLQILDRLLLPAGGPSWCAGSGPVFWVSYTSDLADALKDLVPDDSSSRRDYVWFGEYRSASEQLGPVDA